jgi:two-component sensor histidine kinase
MGSIKTEAAMCDSFLLVTKKYNFMKTKRKNKFEMVSSNCIKKQDKFRDNLFKELQPKIKEMALSIGVDMEHTQHSLYVTDKNYNENNGDDYSDAIDEKFEPFKNMIYQLGDEVGIGFYFCIENGKFRWW